MTAPLRLSRADARRIAVRAQLLTAERPTDLLDVVRHLTLVQLEPTATIAPSADLVLWSRLGATYDPADFRDALDTQQLLEIDQIVRPAGDIALHRAEMAVWPGPPPLKPWQEEMRDWVAANEQSRLEILAALRADGPLPIRELPDTCAVPWRSSGWTNQQNRRRLVDFLVHRGEVAAAGGTGRDRLWDLAERIYPDDPVPPYDEAMLERARRQLAAQGIARPRAAAYPAETVDVEAVGVPVVVEGVRGQWRVHEPLLDEPFRGRAALLSPIDRLVFDRKRMEELFAFDYQLEKYKPAEQRRWGYYALPVLVGDRLVGKLDATAERSEGVLRVDALHEDEPFSRSTREAVRAEVEQLAAWLGLEVLWRGSARV